MTLRMQQMLARGAAEPAQGSVWRGEVVEVLSDGMVWVLVPVIMGSEPVGPLPVFGGPLPARGASVLVLAVAGRRDDLIVLPPAA